MSATTGERPLRIAHTEASRGWGGQEIRILTEAAGLRARGHEVVLYCPPDARIAAEASRYGVPLATLPIGRKAPAGIAALWHALRDAPVDVVNAHSSTDAWLGALAVAMMRPGAAVVRTRHVSVPVPDNAATRWLYRRATTRIVTTGDMLREQLIRDNGIAPERVDSVPTGIDPQAYGRWSRAAARTQCGLPPAGSLIGIVATLRSWKGHRFLIDAVPLLRDRDARLVIVGDGPQADALRTQVRMLGLTGRVLLVGHQHDVAPWLAALDVFALPSYANEGVPQAMLQAMFSGVPVVTTDAGAIPEIATHEVTALIAPRQDAPALARAIDRLLADPALGQRIAEAARAEVAAKYTLDAMLDRMERVFRLAVAQRGTGAGVAPR